MLMRAPSSDTWMWPSSGFGAPVAGCTTLAPIRLTLRVTLRPVVWLGVGSRIWMRASVVGRLVVFELDLPELPPQPAAVTVRASTAGSARRVSLALIEVDLLQG